MEIMRNIHGKEPWPSNHENRQDSFEQHCERMGIFRRSHDFTEHNKYSIALGTTHAKIALEAPESHKPLLTLLIIGYVLNLIHERGMLLLPRNCQN